MKKMKIGFWGGTITAAVLALSLAGCSQGTGSSDPVSPPVTPKQPEVSYRDSIFVQGKNQSYRPSLPGSYYDGESVFSCGEAVPETIADFYMTQYEVTDGWWKEVYDWATDAARGRKIYSFSVGNSLGNGLSYGDAVVWCNALSEYMGREPVYIEEDTLVVARTASRVPQTTTENNHSWEIGNIKVSGGADGFRLPTVGEWQFAARGGDPTDSIVWNYRFSGSDNIDDVAWFSGNANNRGNLVAGGKKANILGFYDLCGGQRELVFSVTVKNRSGYGQHKLEAEGATFMGGSVLDGRDACTVFSVLPKSATDVVRNASFRVVSNTKF